MRKHKLIILFLSACLILSFPTDLSYAAENESDPIASDSSVSSSQENVTEEITYIETLRLSTVEDLLTLAENCRLDTWSQGRRIILEENIDLTGIAFYGIPTFGGTFEGNGHTISGLTLTKEGNVQGLFRYLQSTAIVQDLDVEGHIEPEGTSSILGGLAGNNAGTILRCTFNGQISGTDRIGGLVGNNEVTGILENCTVYGSIQGSHFVGGLVGNNHGVIRDCCNRAEVNTTSAGNSIALEDITLENIANSEATYTTTDMGGIAGTSSGVIRGCINHGNVGYQSMSYNAGGIAGSLTGYLVDCENYGTIHARKDVSGIVGQLEPGNAIQYSEDTLQILSGQIDTLSSLANRTGSHANKVSKELESQLSILQEQGSDARSAAQILLEQYANDNFDPDQLDPDNFDPDNFDPDQWDPDHFDPDQWRPKDPSEVDPDTVTAARNDLSSSLNDFSGTLDSLTSSMSSTLGTLTGDINAMADQFQNISSTLNNAEEDLGFTMTDISDLDTAADTIGKIDSCHNYGLVHADQNGGGIAGTIGLENDLDPEEDVTFRGDQSLNMVYETRAVIRDCQNHTIISIKKTNGGGIVGTMSMGAVLDCVNIGRIDAEAAQSIGGIAGSSNGSIRRCDAKCTIHAHSQIGGIAGSGSTVTDCRALVHIEGDGPEIGAILGSSDTAMSLQASLLDSQRSIVSNYYLPAGQDLGAVDGISYDGCAQPLTLEEFLAMKDLPQYFTMMTLRFVCEGYNDITFQIPVGESFSMEQIPAVPPLELHNGEWDKLADADLSSVWYDQTFTAVYDPFAQTLQTSDTRPNGLPVLLVEGNFPRDAVLTLQSTAKSPTLPEGAVLLESWQIDTTAESEMAIHYLPANDDPREIQRIRIYVQDSKGSWTNREARPDGRYLIFSIAEDETVFCVLEMPTDHTAYYLAACGVGLAVTLALILIVSKKIRKKKNGCSIPEHTV